MKKQLSIIMSALLLCSCAENAPAETTPASSTVTTAETTVTTAAPKITTAAVTETTAQEEPVPEKITEFFYDLDSDGVDEKIMLNPRSGIRCYDSEGNKIGSATGQWAEQMDFITLKWYDDGENIHPALYSDYDCEFAYDEYYVILSLKDGVFEAERLIQWGGLRENYNGVYGAVIMGYYSDVYGDWISKEKYREYDSMVYDNIEDTPSYERNILIKEAIRQLKEDNISLDTYQALSFDLNNDNTDEIVFFSEGTLYCFKREDDTVSFAGKTDFTEESFALEWYNDRKNIFPVLKCTDNSGERFYRISLDNDFTAELFLQKLDGKFYADGAETTEDAFLRIKYYIWHKKQNRLEYIAKAAVENNPCSILYDIENDGIPEQLYMCYGYYYDVEASFTRLDGYSPEFAGGFYMDSDSKLRKYYDSEKDEYFYITTYADAFTTCYSAYLVDKTVFYSNTYNGETLAREDYFYTYYTDEDYDRTYLESSVFMDKIIDSDRYVDSIGLKLYEDDVERYLENYTLVDTIGTEMIDRETAYTYEDFLMQALEIEMKYLNDPSAAKVKTLEQITIGGEAVNITEDYVSIPANTPPEDIAKLSQLKNLDSIYVYDHSDEETDFDLSLLYNAAPNITSLTLYTPNTEPDYETLAKFPKLTALTIHRNYSEEPSDLSALAPLTKLEFLGVSGKITNLDFVKDMSKLKEIRFFASSDEPDCLKTAAELPSLRIFSLSGQGPDVTPEQLRYFADRDDIIIPSLKS